MESADFSAETLQAKREWHNTFKGMKEENQQPGILHPARISFRFDREIKKLTDKQKLRDISTTKPEFKQMLKELLQAGQKKPELETNKQKKYEQKSSLVRQTKSKDRKSPTYKYDIKTIYYGKNTNAGYWKCIGI